MIGMPSYQVVSRILAQLESEESQEYLAIVDLFKHTKRLYSPLAPFLSARALAVEEPQQINVLRKANIATFTYILFGDSEGSLVDLCKCFLDCFAPDGGRLLKVHGALFLDLMTQAVIQPTDAQKDDSVRLLTDIFPDDLEARILCRRSGAKTLAPTEQDFVNRARSRREILMREIKTSTGLKALQTRYSWDRFLRESHQYFTKNLHTILDPNVSQSLYPTSQPRPRVDSLHLLLIHA